MRVVRKSKQAKIERLKNDLKKLDRRLYSLEYLARDTEDEETKLNFYILASETTKLIFETRLKLNKLEGKYEKSNRSYLQER